MFDLRESEIVPPGCYPLSRNIVGKEEAREEKAFDAVKNPSHYTEGREYAPKDVIRDWGLNFNLGNAVKYISRAGRKSDIIEDLKKAQTYLQFEIDAIEKEREKYEDH